MSVPSSKRKLSDLEFYRQSVELRNFISFELLPVIHNDLVTELTKSYPNMTEDYQKNLLNITESNLLRILQNMFLNITAANSIYPTTIEECNVRRSKQQLAISFCNALLPELEYLAKIDKNRTSLIIQAEDKIDHTQRILRDWKKGTNKFEKNITKGIKSEKSATFCNVNENGNANINNATNVGGVCPDLDNSQHPDANAITENVTLV